MKKLNALFIPTSNSGTVFWRMYQYYVSAYRQGIANMPVLWWKKNVNEVQPWEREITLNFDNQYLKTNEMWLWAKQADVIIYGMLHGSGTKVITPNASEDYIESGLRPFYALKDIRDNKQNDPQAEFFKNRVILSEIDDNMMSTPGYNPAAGFYAPYQELRQIAIRQFRESDGLIVSTNYLKTDVYNELNDNIHVIPNAIDFSVWDKLQCKNKPGIRIGWAGGANHENDLRIMEQVIPAINEKHKNIRWIFVHGCPHYLRKVKGVEYISKWTDIDKYPKMLAAQDFDIGIAPLEDNAFNRGKSNLRWLEYSALKIPSVLSNVGPYKESVQGTRDGLLANTVEEWVSQLDSLIADKKLRREIGLNAYRRVKRDFNLDNIAIKYVGILSKEVAKRAETVAEVLA